MVPELRSPSDGVIVETEAAQPDVVTADKSKARPNLMFNADVVEVR